MHEQPHINTITILSRKNSNSHNLGSNALILIKQDVANSPAFRDQYLVYQPRARITACKRRGIDSISLVIKAYGIAAHAFLIHSVNSALCASFFLRLDR